MVTSDLMVRHSRSKEEEGERGIDKAWVRWAWECYTIHSSQLDCYVAGGRKDYDSRTKHLFSERLLILNRLYLFFSRHILSPHNTLSSSS